MAAMRYRAHGGTGTEKNNTSSRLPVPVKVEMPATRARLSVHRLPIRQSNARPVNIYQIIACHTLGRRKQTVQCYAREARARVYANEQRLWSETG